MSSREQLEAFAAVHTLPQAFARDRDITTELISLRRELGQLLVAERAQREHLYATAQDPTVTDREHSISYQTLEVGGEVITLKAEIAAYAEEQSFLRFYYRDKDTSHIPG